MINEALVIRAEIEKLFKFLGDKESSKRLKNTWSIFKLPFFVQSTLIISVVCYILYVNIIDMTTNSSNTTNTLISKVRPLAKVETKYSRPSRAPNGSSWPVIASYLQDFPVLFSNGLSSVTVDNSQNDTDVLVKLMSLNRELAIPVRTFYIPAQGSFTLKNINMGNYDIRYRDLNSGHLSRSENFFLEEIKEYNGTRFSNLTMTLFKVRNGNMNTYDLREEDF